MRNYILIENDVYFISQRLKEIDKGYFIVLNKSKQKFEVHNIFQRGGSYCFTLPYSCLDQRAIDYTLKTRSQNMEKIIQEIDAQNKQIEANNLKIIRNKIEEVLL